MLPADVRRASKFTWDDGDFRIIPSRSRNEREDDAGQDDIKPGSILQTDHYERMAAIRDVFTTGGPRDRAEAIRDVAQALGYARVGSRIQQVLDDGLRAAVRRGILDNTGGQLSLLCRSIGEYTRDHLINMLLSDMGTNWWDRDDLVTATARYLGFRRTGAEIRRQFKSAINGAIRRGLLEYDGNLVRKCR